MKLLNLEFIKGEYVHPLEGFNHHFHRPSDYNQTHPICLAGVNGSGKSKLLEVLSEIFYYLNHYYSEPDYNEKTKIQFKLEYLMESPTKTLVRICQLEERGIPTFEVVNNRAKKLIIDKSSALGLLPKFLVAYSSGDNETLSKRYEDTYMEYSEAVTDLEKNPTDKDVPDTKLVFLDYKVNSYVFIANSIFRSVNQLKLLFNNVKRLHSLESFRIVIQEDPKYKNRVAIRTTPELRRYINALKKCATFYYEENENKRTTLDFYLDEATKKAFKKHFRSPFHLYTSLYKLDLLNDILLRREKKRIMKEAEYPNQKHLFPQLSIEDKVFNIENIRVNLKGVTNDIDYYDLSDGEHQFIHVMGSILMIDNSDTLFLLDEPETHFNPQWRSKFISTLTSIKHTAKQDFFITTHSPFIIGDCDKNNVLIFENGVPRTPDVQTFGLSVDRILKEAFGVIPPMAEKSLMEIQKLQKSSSITNIQNRIDNFGESIEKFYLYNRLGELKSKAKGKKK